MKQGKPNNGQSQKIYNSLFDSIEINNSIIQLNARSGGGPTIVGGRNAIKRKNFVANTNPKHQHEAMGDVSKSMNMNPFKTQEDINAASRNAVNRSFCFDSHNNSIQQQHALNNSAINGGGSFLNHSYEYPNGLNFNGQVMPPHNAQAVANIPGNPGSTISVGGGGPNFLNNYVISSGGVQAIGPNGVMLGGGGKSQERNLGSKNPQLITLNQKQLHQQLINQQAQGPQRNQVLNLSQAKSLNIKPQP